MCDARILLRQRSGKPSATSFVAPLTLAIVMSGPRMTCQRPRDGLLTMPAGKDAS